MERRAIVAAVMLAAFVSVPAARAPQAPAPAAHAMIYVEPTEDGFETYIVAAIIKKKVPASVVEKADSATLILKPGKVEEHKVSTGSKVVKCLFAYCAGTDDKANTNVELVDGSGIIVWSYSVNKGRGEKNRQSMAEAIASHLKSEYFHQ